MLGKDVKVVEKHGDRHLCESTLFFCLKSTAGFWLEIKWSDLGSVRLDEGSETPRMARFVILFLDELWPPCESGLVEGTKKTSERGHH